MSKKSTRRAFLSSTVAATTVLSGRSLQASKKPGPNDQINLGLIGCGGRGRRVMRAHLEVPGVKIAAVCDVNSKRLLEGVKECGNPSVQTYRDFRKLLEQKDIHAVIIATHDHWHALATIFACQAGKDVYVEKPLGTSIGEGRACIQAAEKYQRIVQFGTQQHSGEHYQEAAEIIQSGYLGEISEVKVWDYDNFYPGFGSPPDGDPPEEFGEQYWDFWLGPSPKVKYNPNRFRHHYWFFDYGGGWPLDWAVHHFEIMNWYMKVTSPLTITALGGFKAFDDTNTEWPDTFSGVCEYGPCPVAKKGFLMQYTFRGACIHSTKYFSAHSKLFCGSDASLQVDRSGFTIWEERKSPRAPEPWPGGSTRVERRVEAQNDGTVNHARNFIDCVRNRKHPAADVVAGHYASNPGHLLNISWRVGRRITWDAKTEQIPDDPEANALVTKRYRAPWKLEV